MQCSGFVENILESRVLIKILEARFILLDVASVKGWKQISKLWEIRDVEMYLIYYRGK